MPYFKCTACRIRLSEAGTSTDRTDDACPVCGGPWEFSSRAVDVLGYQRLSPPPPAAATGQGLWRLAARVADVRSEDLP